MSFLKKMDRKVPFIYLSNLNTFLRIIMKIDTSNCIYVYWLHLIANS